MELIDIIKQQARAAECVDISIDSAQSWISVTDKEDLEMSVFIQGEDAADLIDEIEFLWRRIGTITKNEAAAHVLSNHIELVYH